MSVLVICDARKGGPNLEIKNLSINIQFHTKMLNIYDKKGYFGIFEGYFGVFNGHFGESRAFPIFGNSIVTLFPLQVEKSWSEMYRVENSLGLKIPHSQHAVYSALPAISWFICLWTYSLYLRSKLN